MRSIVLLFLSLAMVMGAPGIRRVPNWRPTAASFTANPAFVQKAQTDSGTVANGTKTYTNAVAAGSLLVVCVREGASGGTCTVTNLNTGGAGAASDTWTEAINFGSSDSHTNRIFWAKNAAGGTCKVGVTFNTGAASMRWVLLEYSGMNTTSQPDKTAGATGATTSLDSGSVTTTTANQVLVGFGTIQNTANFTVGASFTQREVVPIGAAKLMVEDRIVSATGTYNGTETTDATDPGWVMTICTFK